jgi:hypothetical protein
MKHALTRLLQCIDHVQMTATFGLKRSHSSFVRLVRRHARRRYSVHVIHSYDSGVPSCQAVSFDTGSDDSTRITHRPNMPNSDGIGMVPKGGC